MPPVVSILKATVKSLTPRYLSRELQKKKDRQREREREKSSILGTGDIVTRLTPRHLSASCSKRTRSIVREHVL